MARADTTGRGAPRADYAVLILDDERFERHRLARLCSGLEANCKVTTAVSIKEFEQQLEAAEFDLILVDYLLPDGTGLEALGAVRCSARNYQSATIMVSGQIDAEVAHAALRVGCSDYLSKDTLTPDSFKRAVANALQKTVLSLDGSAQTFERAQVEAVLEAFASRFARDIKPMISRTLRQLRDSRSQRAGANFAATEASCIEIWETLVELERSSGEDMISDTLMQSNLPMSAAQIPPRKPPSPFARVRS